MIAPGTRAEIFGEIPWPTVDFKLFRTNESACHRYLGPEATPVPVIVSTGKSEHGIGLQL